MWQLKDTLAEQGTSESLSFPLFLAFSPIILNTSSSAVSSCFLLRIEKVGSNKIPCTSLCMGTPRNPDILRFLLLSKPPSAVALEIQVHGCARLVPTFAPTLFVFMWRKTSVFEHEWSDAAVASHAWVRSYSTWLEYPTGLVLGSNTLTQLSDQTNWVWDCVCVCVLYMAVSLYMCDPFVHLYGSLCTTVCSPPLP